MELPKQKDESFDQPILNPYRRMMRQGNGTEEEALYIARLREKGYEILGEIGRGGFGVVYKAKDPHSQKLFAIKVNFDVVCRSTIFLEVAFYHLLKRKRNMPKIVDVFSIEDVTHIVIQYFEHNTMPVHFE